MRKDLDKKELIPKFSEESLNRTIESCKLIYSKNEADKIISNKEFLILQAKFIDKKLWILQFLMMVFLVFVLINNSQDVIFNSSTYFAIIIPLLVVVTIPELFKSTRYNTFEIENCSYFSIKKVYLAKLLIIAMSDLIFFSIIICVAYRSTGLPLYQIIIYFLVPFNSTCCICFTVLANGKKKISEFTAISTGIIWTVIMYSLSKYISIYQLFQTSLWIGLLIISMIYILFILKKILTNTANYLEIMEFSN